MSDILKEICDKRREDVATAKGTTPVSVLFEQIENTKLPRGFAHNIQKTVASRDIALIAEIKRASPSQGDIRTDFDLTACAKAYEKSGAICLSVLTEPHWFRGQDDFIQDVKQAIKLPILRKDFMVDPYQIIQSRALGADCVLLIMAALDDALAHDMCQIARDLGMSTLVEVHDATERDRALNLDFDLLGINNRNLKTMDIDIKTTLDLSQDVPIDITIVSESGLKTYDDLKMMMDRDIYTFLVGTSLMRHDDLSQATRALLGHS